MDRKTRRTFCVVGLLGVVSAVGCGQGEAVERPCGFCRGEGRYRCSTCNGHGYIQYRTGFGPRAQVTNKNCLTCNGEGGKDCTHCKGTGKTKSPPNPLEWLFSGAAKKKA